MKKMLLLIALVLFTTGCVKLSRHYVYIHDRYPVYDVPEKSEIAKISNDELSKLDDDVKKKVVDTVASLKVESTKLRAILESYNDYAVRKNYEYDKIFAKD